MIRYQEAGLGDRFRVADQPDMNNQPVELLVVGERVVGVQSRRTDELWPSPQLGSARKGCLAGRVFRARTLPRLP